MEAEAWKLFTGYGVMGATFFFAGWGIVRIVRWWAPKVDELWKALIGLIHETRTQVNNLGANSAQLINITQAQAEASERIESQLITTVKTMDGHTYQLNSLGQRVDAQGVKIDEIHSRLPKAGG